MPSPRPDLIPGLNTAYQTQVTQVRARVRSYIEHSWRGLGAWRDKDIARFVASVVPVVTGGERTVAALTDAYLARHAVFALGGTAVPQGVSDRLVTGAATRNGTPPADVYVRAGKQTWTALARGYGLDAAVQQGLDRAVEAAMTDLQRTKALTAQQIVASSEIHTGSRRMLEGPSSCGLCVLASTQRYSKRELMPIHPACDCSVEPLYGIHRDQVLEPERLADLHKRAEDFFGTPSGRAESAGSHGAPRPVDYRDFVVVHDHGELGPVLSRKGQNFTGPDDLN